MLIDDFKALELDPISKMVGDINGNSFIPKRLQKGIYLRPDFGSSHFLPEYEQYNYNDNLSINQYGVCDNFEQILNQCIELQDLNREFIITLTPVLKENQSPTGGWRWHKWGPYIGKYKPKCEYLFDERDIDKVYVYHIYEKIKEK